MKKTFYIIVPCIIFPILFWIAAQYFMFCRNPIAPQVPETAVLSTDNTVPVGEQLLCTTDFNLPYCGKISNVSVSPGRNAVVSGVPAIKNGKLGILSVVKSITVPLRMISPGNTADAEFSFSTEIAGKKFNHVVKIPQFQTSEPSSKGIETLQLASKEEIVEQSNILRNTLIVAAVLVVTAIFLYVVYLLKFRKKNTALSDWEKTRRELHNLKSDISESRITPENGFIRLTDLVRGYLEKRFGLPATRRTTPEFIEDISHNCNFVPDDRKPFLRNFLEAADQVKFAMAYPEKELLNKALANAESLVEATRPPEEEKNV